MKKFFISVAVLLGLCASAWADEGMWMLPLIQKLNSKAMSEAGCKISAKDIYNVNRGSLKDAVVRFGRGCTGEIISDKGLLITNHHCGYGQIQALSTPEHNYLEDGYWAKNLSEELPCPGLSVTFLKSMTDVTSEVTKKLAKEMEFEEIVESIEEKAKAKNPGCDANVVSFYNDNQYYLVITKEYKDVRFVGAPPAAVGKFGGDTDNWMWPRHTCDFSMFRVYADKNNEPAEYSETNVPYKPKKYLTISLNGVEEGDFTMVLGYPGRTQRYQTAAELKQMLACNDVMVKARTVRQDLMWEAMRADPVVSLQYASKYASSSNYWKKWQGEQLAFDKLGVIGKQLNKEAELTKWITSDKKRNQKWGDAIELIEDAVANISEFELYYDLAVETLARIELSNFAATELRTNIGDMASLYENYNVELDKKIAAAMLKHFVENVPADYLPHIDSLRLDEIDIDEYVEDLYEQSVFTSYEKLVENLDESGKAPQDKALEIRSALLEFVKAIRPEDLLEQREKLLEGKQKYAAALLEYNKKAPKYPDANSTMRMTYGNVMSYSPKDAVLYKHYTTLKGVMEKEDPDNYEFRVPFKLKEIYLTNNFGKYTNDDGVVPTCFISNNDITGGNSGSPVLNAYGNLVGLAFDGNWESMSGDVLFEPELQRCICVDIRYVLLMVDKYGDAGYLLKEMKFEKKAKKAKR